jgi:hypothetical protein
VANSAPGTMLDCLCQAQRRALRRSCRMLPASAGAS